MQFLVRALRPTVATVIKQPRTMMTPVRTYYSGTSVGDAIVMGMGLVALGGVGVGATLSYAWNYWKKPTSMFVLPPLNKQVCCPYLSQVLAGTPTKVKVCTHVFVWMRGGARIE
jgi:hypothetical protein